MSGTSFGNSQGKSKFKMRFSWLFLFNLALTRAAGRFQKVKTALNICLVNGGSSCYMCMIFSSWIDQYSRSNQLRQVFRFCTAIYTYVYTYINFISLSFENGLTDVCSILPNILGTLCRKIDDELRDYIGGLIIDALRQSDAL